MPSPLALVLLAVIGMAKPSKNNKTSINCMLYYALAVVGMAKPFNKTKTSINWIMCYAFPTGTGLTRRCWNGEAFQQQ